MRPAGRFRMAPPVAADFDGDGVPDVLAVSDLSSAADSIFFYKGVGDGTFLAATTVTNMWDINFDINTADFNGDGYLDIIGTGAAGTAGCGRP